MSIYYICQLFKKRISLSCRVSISILTKNISTHFFLSILPCIMCIQYIEGGGVQYIGGYHEYIGGGGGV